MSAGSRQVPPMPMVMTASGNRSRILRDAVQANPAALGASGEPAAGLRGHDHYFAVPHGGDRARHPGDEEVLDRGRYPPGERHARAGPVGGTACVDGHGQDPVLARVVIAQVPGPPADLAGIARAAEQQSFHQVVTHLAGRGGHHPLPAENHAADGGRVLGDQQADVAAVAVLRAAERHQVGRHVVAYEDRRDDDGDRAANLGQPQRPARLRSAVQDGAQARVRDVPARVLRDLVVAGAWTGGGQDLQAPADHRHGRRGSLREQPQDRRHVRVLQSQAGQVLVDSDQLAQQAVLTVDGTLVQHHRRVVGHCARVLHGHDARRPVKDKHCARAQTGSRPSVGWHPLMWFR